VGGHDSASDSDLLSATQAGTASRFLGSEVSGVCGSRFNADRRCSVATQKTVTCVASFVVLVLLTANCSDQGKPTAPNNDHSRPSLELSGEETSWGAIHEEGPLAVEPLTAAYPPSNGQFVNGSFETGDYSGWTLWEGNNYHNPLCGTWGIAEDGQTILRLQYVWDFFDGILISQQSLGLPETYEASDGDYVAFQLQNCAERHRLYQDVTVGPDATVLSWDMRYADYHGQFSDRQELAVTVRDPGGDNHLETLFVTTEGVSPHSIPMTTFHADLSAYAGQTIRIGVDMTVYNWFFHVSYDNFRFSEMRTVPPVAADRDGDGLVCYRQIGPPGDTPTSGIPQAVFIDDRHNACGCPCGGWTSFQVPGATACEVDYVCAH